MLRDDVLKLAKIYAEYLDLIREFISDALALVDGQELTELWVEQYEQPNRRIGVTPLKNGRIGTMLWSDDIADFDQILAFFRHKDINLFRVPGESVGRVDGILFNEQDIATLRTLDKILEGAP